MKMSPYVTCVCPSCFEQIYLGECRIMSGKTDGKELKAPKGRLARMKVESLIGPQYALELAYRECTNCGYALPPNIEQVPSIALVVVGDTFAGKSHYIAALIHQLKADWLGSTTGFARLTCLTPKVEKEYTQKYFRQLFVQKTVIPATLHAVTSRQEPLIYNLTFSPSPKYPNSSMNLMLYDTSGEDYVNPDKLVEVARFALHTNALIFVADPFTMTDLYWQLPDPLQILLKPEFQVAQGSRAADKFNEIITVFERYHSYSRGSTLPDTPVAIMITKSDLFDSVMQPNSCRFMKNPRYGGGVDLRDIDMVDREVKDLLIKYGQNDLLATTKKFRKIKFFATSATGEPPDTNKKFTNVIPRRCLDPVLWILHQLDVIEGD